MKILAQRDQYFCALLSLNEYYAHRPVSLYPEGQFLTHGLYGMLRQNDIKHNVVRFRLYDTDLDHPIGRTAISFNPNAVFCDSDIDLPYQGLYLSDLLYEARFKYLSDLGIHYTELYTRRDNEISRGAARRNGFVLRDAHASGILTYSRTLPLLEYHPAVQLDLDPLTPGV